jgi:hypothetical protein
MYGADQSYADTAYAAMQGSYLGIVPRSSTFFFPENRIRRDIIKEHPDVSAVSFFLNGFTKLSIKVSPRDAIARWCGLSPTEGVDEYCYVFDGNGLIFAAVGSSTPLVNSFKLYDPLEGDGVEPLGAILAHANILPHVFDFARQLNTLGSPVIYTVIKGDEVNQYLKSGTRITYVLGNEQNAYTALVSSKENFNLADGSVEYIDLRFGGKVYVKKKNDTVSE